jgi:uncharacterized membrane protein
MTDPTFDDELAELGKLAARLQRSLDELRDRLKRLEQQEATTRPTFDTTAPLAGPPETPPIREREPAIPRAEPVIPPAPPTAPPTRPPSPLPAVPVGEAPASAGERLAGLAAGRQQVADEGRPRGEAPASTGGAELVIGRTWLNRIGAVILLLAVAFFVKYSFDQGWISPGLRVVVGAFLGVGLVAAGEYCLFRKMRPFAGGLLGCGVGVLYLVAFGAYNLYELVNTQTAAVFYICITALSVAISVHGRLLPIAILAVIGGYGTPIALSTGTNQQVALLTYVLLLDVGFLISAHIRRWDILRPLAWLGTLGLFGAWFLEFSELSTVWRTWAFLLAFYVVFHGEALGALRRGSYVWPRLMATIIHANNVVFFGGTYLLLRGLVPEWLGLFAVVLAGVQWLAAWRVVGGEAAVLPARLGLWLNGAAMLALAAPLQFDRYLVSVSWGVQAVVTFWFCRRFADQWLRLKGVGVLGAAVLHLFIFEYQDPELTSILWEVGRHWTFSWVVALFAFAGLCSYASGAVLAVRRTPEAVEDKKLAAGLMALGSGLLLWLFADQWERYLATWWWLGLAVAWWAVAWRFRPVAGMAVALTAAVCVKFLAWDTLAATRGAWSDIEGIILNRAVLTGVLVAGLAAGIRPFADRLPEAVKQRLGWSELGRAFVVAAALVITWTGTFEIARVFRFEQWAQEHFTHPLHARGVFITAFWALQAAVMWVIAGLRRPTVSRYALILMWLTILKMMAVDTVFAAGSERWAELSGICANRIFLVGLLVIATGLGGYWNARRIAAAGGAKLFDPLTVTVSLVLVTLLITWVPTFEILRVFRFEPFRLRFSDPGLAMHLALSVFWSVNATVCLALGFARRVAVLRHLALGLFGITVVKVFIFDLSRLETVYRIISFAVLGVLLLFASLLYQRLSSRIAESLGHDPLRPTCKQCGYDLTGNVSGVCPECGKSI